MVKGIIHVQLYFFMRIKSFIATAILAGSAALLVACGEKKDPSKEAFDALIQSVPADAAFFAGGYIPLDEQIEVYGKGEWKKVLAALQGNPAVVSKVEKSLETSGDVKYFFKRWLAGVDMLKMLEEACEIAPAPTAFVAYTGGDLDSSADGLPPFVFAATMAKKYVDSLEHFLVCCKRENEQLGQSSGTWTREAADGKTLYVYTEKDVSVVFAFRGNELIVSSSHDDLKAFEARMANPPASLLKDSAVFKKSMRGADKHNFVAFLNFAELKEMQVPEADETPAQKAFRESAESVAVFAELPFVGKTADACVRMEFKNPILIHEVITQMASLKLETLANALPGADYVLGLALPPLSDELADMAEIPAKERERLKRFEPQRFYLSIADAEKLGAALSGDYMNLPEVFAKLDCGDNAVLLEDPNIAQFFDGSNPIAQKQTINGTSVYSSFMFGIKYALLGKTGLYVSNSFDAPATLALAQGNGKSLAQDGMFNALEEKLAGENALEGFVDDRAGIELQIALADGKINETTAAGELEYFTLAKDFQKLLLALTKKSVSGVALRRNGTAIELHWSCEYEYDFNALCEEIKNLK